MKRTNFFVPLLLMLLMACGANQKNKLTSKVNPFIGTGGHGHTYPGAAMPFGMIQLSPDQRTTGWDWCSGYHYSDNSIKGFSHTHLSGTGIGDYGDILLMPTTGKLNLKPGSIEKPDEGYRSRFSHDKEQASPGYYQVFLDDYNINVELTAGLRAGMHRYTFAESKEANIIIDLEHGVNDVATELRLDIVSDTEVVGMRHSRGWAGSQYVYFVMQFSKPFEAFGIETNGKLNENERNSVGTKSVKGYLRYSTKKDEEITVKIGISAVSIEGARNNLNSEIEDWDFDNIRKKADETWENELSKIEIEGGSKEQQEIFYTALYHSFLAPNIYSDADGQYRGHDMKIHKINDGAQYTVFSLWDTFRALHPLLTIVDRKRTSEFIETFLRQYEEGGRLPVWELAANETECMIGYHSISVIADAYAKGIRGFDTRKALDAMVYSASLDHFGLESYKKNGYILVEDEAESVSRTLEYAYDDWCIAQMAETMNQNEIAEEFTKRSQYYKNIFDPETGFMRGKLNSTWTTPFDPREVNFNFTEANSWQYSFFAPHDITGLIEIMGGEETFSEKLDLLFTESSETTGRQQSDITGLIGQYAHGNEPSHHMAYLYNYIGQPWKTQERVNEILTGQYTTKPDGLAGNEDCGQMSAWYVLSSMGFYSVTPGSNIYAIGSPLFSKVTLNLEDNKTFTIIANNLSPENIYIQSATLNDKPHSKSWLRHTDIAGGGNLVFEMGAKPGKDWGVGAENIPVSAVDKIMITPVPYLKSESRTFTDSLVIEFGCIDKEAKIYYTLNGEPADENSKQYSTPITLTEAANINAVSIGKNGVSKTINAVFSKIPKDRKITIKSEYSNQYSAGGDRGLIDYLRGAANYKTGMWQGYEGVDVEAIVELAKVKTISKIAAGFLQDQDSWIFMPSSVQFYTSIDGKKFTEVGTVENDVPKKTTKTIVKDFGIDKNIRAKFIKIIARNSGQCPEWHKGAGGNSWIFIDEIVVE